MTQEELYQVAIEYKRAGLEVIANDPHTKFPKGLTNWQEMTFTDDILYEYIVNKGYVLGVRNIEGLDFDNKSEPSAKEMLKRWAEIIKSADEELLNKLLIESTPSGGFHVVWRCPYMEKNTKLACNKGVALIETRGLGGQFMVSPSPGYEVLRGSWNNLPIITQEDRNILIMSALMLDMEPVVLDKKKDHDHLENKDGFFEKYPSSDYNQDPQSSVYTLNLLKKHGWLVVGQHNDVFFLRRPGKDAGVSATFNHVAPGVFYNFSANGAPFEPSSGYTPFGVLAQLEYNGDWGRASQAVIEQWEDEGPFVPEENLPQLKEKKTAHALSPEDTEILRGDQLLTAQLPTENWIINRIIPSEGFAIFVAKAGSWKTFLTLSLAQAAVSGTPWLEHDLFHVNKPCKVLFIDKENPLSLIQQRIKGLNFTPAMARNMGWVKHPEKLQLYDPKKNILTEFITILGKKVKEEGYDLIILDSLVDFILGDENTAKDTQMFFDAVRSAFTGKAVLLLHHENKPSNGIQRSDADRSRGNSNINGQAGIMFRVEPSPVDQTTLYIKQIKGRYTQLLDKFKVKVDVETVNEQEKETVVRGFKYLGDIEDTSGSSGKSDACSVAIKDLLSEFSSMSRASIISYCSDLGISKATVERTLRELADDKVIAKMKDGKDINYLLRVDLES